MTVARKALVLGASGLVGRAVCKLLSSDPGVSEIHALARSPIARLDPTVRTHTVDFQHLDATALPPVDEVYCCLGTTRADAGSEEAFRWVDHDLPLLLARLCQTQGAKRFGLVSAMGADRRSRIFYSRVKGELEEDLKALGFELLVCARPALLDGARAGLGQRTRWAERLTLAALHPLSALIPMRYRPITPEAVAGGLVGTLCSGARGTIVLESDEMQRSAKEAR